MTGLTASIAARLRDRAQRNDAYRAARRPLVAVTPALPEIRLGDGRRIPRAGWGR